MFILFWDGGSIHRHDYFSASSTNYLDISKRKKRREEGEQNIEESREEGRGILKRRRIRRAKERKEDRAIYEHRGILKSNISIFMIDLLFDFFNLKSTVVLCVVYAIQKCENRID